MNRRTFLKTLTLGLAGGAVAKAVSLGDKAPVLPKAARDTHKAIEATHAASGTSLSTCFVGYTYDDRQPPITYQIGDAGELVNERYIYDGEKFIRMADIGHE